MGFGFADSTTLRGFEEISRGARRWDPTHPPEELTHHTKLTDDRSASFLHLRITKSNEMASAIDLLISDLPGEWTTELIGKERVDRLGFLKRADVIWLVIDGTSLQESETRLLSGHRIELLIARLRKFLSDSKPPLIFVLTRRDKGGLEAASLTELRAIGSREGFETEVVEIASFAPSTSDVKPGHGIDDLIEKTTRSGDSTIATWPESIRNDSFVLPKIGLKRSV